MAIAIPSATVPRLVSDEQLVAEAVSAREEAEVAEAEAGSPSRWREAESYATLSKRGWSTRQIATACKTNKDTVSRFIRCVEDCIGTDTRPQFWSVYAKITGEKKRGDHASRYSSESDEWETPQDLFDLLNEEFQFTLDVCATPDTAKCAEFFSPEDNGLTEEWLGSCWMNPPYGDEIGKWVARAYESAKFGSATVVCLLPARVDTAWWWDHCRYGEIRFLRGRLKFGSGENSAPFPSAVVIFGAGHSPKTVWWEKWRNPKE